MPIKPRMFEPTDLSRWHLTSEGGRHRWAYDAQSQLGSSEQTEFELYLLGRSLASTKEHDSKKESKPRSFEESAHDGMSFYSRLQLPEGHWACDYGGPSFLLPGLIFAMYISDTPIPQEWKAEIVRYLENAVNEDGGWGLHIEGTSTVFATGLYYVMLRLLGMEKDYPLARNARSCLLSLGGAIGSPQWGKIWLACLNLYDWDGVNCIPVDLWILPSWLPIHPSRWWVQCRVVYLPTSYLWSNRCSKPLNPLLAEIRSEIYTIPFDELKFSDHCNTTAPSDALRSISPFLLFMFFLMNMWCTYLRPQWIHKLANKTVSRLMDREEANTDFECLAPVNKAFHMTAAWFQNGPDLERLQRHREKIDCYLWIGPNGMTCNGTNGVQVWDTAFTVQAATEAGLSGVPLFQKTLQKAHEYLEQSQLRDDLDDPFRQGRKGGWPFSTKSNGYIVSDCAAESLKAVLMLQNESSYPTIVDESRLRDCVDTLLTMQNSNGGFSSYEKIRGSEYLELLNPAEVFDKIMVEYSYVECTSAVLTALLCFHRHFPTYRAADIRQRTKSAVKFIHREQRADGSWYGSWAICFNYASFLTLQGLEAVGEQWGNSEVVKKACDFILSKQMEDGGWGEHHSSCSTGEYVCSDESQVVNTAWAVLGLMYAGYPNTIPIQKGLQLIQSRQQPNGEWLQELVEGVFNRTCMIGYPNYKFYFPIMALGTYRRTYLPKVDAGNSNTD